MNFLVVLGREPKLSLVELEAVFGTKQVQLLDQQLAQVTSDSFNLERLGGSIKAAQLIDQKPLDYLAQLPAGKITLGLSDYTPGASANKTWKEALKYKNLLTRHGRSVRLIANNSSATIPSATAHHNQLGEKLNHIELIKFRDRYAVSIGTQNITSYAKRDQARPARDAFVGMLPPKLAQILINLASAGTQSGMLLDPFCGTGVVLQEALLMGFSVYGTDLSDKMIDYSQRNLDWLAKQSRHHLSKQQLIHLEPGDATTHKWQLASPSFVASETYLGHPLSNPPGNAKLVELKHEAKDLTSRFLKNLSAQLAPDTQIAIAVPAWRRTDGTYSGILQDLLDDFEKLDYNLVKYKYAEPSDLLYYRENQVVARQIIVLRKK